MIVLTRLSGRPMVLNCDLIERVESTPETVLTLVDGRKVVVEEPLDEVIHLAREYRASVIAMAHGLEPGPTASGRRARLRSLPGLGGIS